jgi:hypothetical protein
MLCMSPVYPHSRPDPFVLKYCGEYWCYSISRAPEGLFKILHSLDLGDWESAGRERGTCASTLPNARSF